MPTKRAPHAPPRRKKPDPTPEAAHTIAAHSPFDSDETLHQLFHLCEQMSARIATIERILLERSI